MPVNLIAEETIKIGQPITVEGPSPSTQFGVVFEDDGETGYLYGLDFSRQGQPIVDALHIYNVKQVTDQTQASVVQIVWSQDGLKAGLVINKYPHAIFDFAARRGYCRTGFPPADPKWTNFGHAWDDEAEALFK